MKTTFYSFLTALLILPASACGPAPNVNDTTRFDGEWNAVDMSVNGDAVSLAPPRRVFVTIKDQQFTMVDEGGTHLKNEGTAAVRVDETKKPAHLDLVYLDGADAGKTRLGLFALEGDKLKLALGSVADKKRPEYLHPGPGVTALTLEKKK